MINIYTKMTLTKDLAEKLDLILKEAERTGESTIDASQYATWKHSDIEIVGSYLEKCNLGKMLTGEWIMIFPQAVSFIQENSFRQIYEEQREQVNREERQDILIKKQIKAAKREPYLIAWGIFTTIISLILAFLQLIKQ